MDITETGNGTHETVSGLAEVTDAGDADTTALSTSGNGLAEGETGGTTSVATEPGATESTAVTGTSVTDDIADELCDIWKQDCPDGQKCMPWADDGGSSWNSTTCTALDADPATAGETCLAEGGGLSGVDNCAPGMMCWFVDLDNVGTCLELCTGSPDSPVCPDGKTCEMSNQGVINLCYDTCDPLAKSCPEGLICIFESPSDFICEFDASGEGGQYGEPCAFINVCDDGLYCAPQDEVPGCESPDGCCSLYCDLTAANTCPGMTQECLPWYGEGQQTPAGQENIGACAVP